MTQFEIMPRTSPLILLGLSQSPSPPPQDGWSSPGGDPGARRFSALTQITRDNVGTLRQAWSFDTGARNLQVTPIVIDGVMYVTGGEQRLRARAGDRQAGVAVRRPDQGQPARRRVLARRRAR